MMLHSWMAMLGLPAMDQTTPNSSAPALRASRRPSIVRPFDGIRALLRVLDAMLSAIESTVWELRLAAEDFARAARSDATAAREGIADASARLARLTSTSATLSL